MSGCPAGVRDTPGRFPGQASRFRALGDGTVLATGPRMLGIIQSASLLGVSSHPITVEVGMTSGLPVYNVVGLPTASVKEGAVRIRSALEHVGQTMPARRITVNLAPADLRKDGAAFDLPIAIGVLVADEQIPAAPFERVMVLGELGLDGSLRPIRGTLSSALLARASGMRGILVPTASAKEAAVVEDLEVFAADSLAELLESLDARGALPRFQASAAPATAPSSHRVDMSDVRGQATARRAMEVSVAGGHNLLMTGPPGIGKTMLARRIPTILPGMTYDEALETTQIYSAIGMARDGLVTARPFRAPHHTISSAALLGGGSIPRPGEISLAHNGVLFLDELPEFNRHAIESLRQPLEDREVTVTRVRGNATMPASFLLVGSANPCPCGWLGSRDRACTCSGIALQRYRNRLSGPLLDRMDLQVFVPNVPLATLRCSDSGEPSAAMRARVVEARERQRRRLAEHGCRTNAEMGPRALRATCLLAPKAEATLARLHRVRNGMTARTVNRLIKVARTIADLAGQDVVSSGCMLEASAYRALDAEPGMQLRGVVASNPA